MLWWLGYAETTGLLASVLNLAKHKLIFEDLPKKVGKLKPHAIIKRGGKLIALRKTAEKRLRSTIKRLKKWWKRPKKYEFTIKIRWVLALFLLLHFYPTHRVIAYPEPQPELKHYSEIKPIETPEQPKAVSTTQSAPKPPTAPPNGSHEDWMRAAGIAESDFGYVDYIVSHESGWRVNAYNPSGAFGLCQSLPGSKMASAGADWQDNPVTQLRWCNSYAIARGGWAASYYFWLNHRWW